MIDFNLYFAFIIATIIVIATPGPSVLYIVARSLNLGVKGGIISAIGVTIGAVLHAIAVSLGLAQLLAASPEYFAIIKNLGCAYLIYIGIKTLLAREEDETDGSTLVNKHKNVLLQGILVQFLNPKAALFSLAFLPQFTNATFGNVDTQIIILSFTVVAIGFINDITCAIVVGHFGKSLKRSSLFRKIEKYISGGICGSLGVLGLCYKIGKE